MIKHKKRNLEREKRERSRYKKWIPLLDLPPIDSVVFLDKRPFKIVGINTTQTKIFVENPFDVFFEVKREVVQCAFDDIQSIVG